MFKEELYNILSRLDKLPTADETMTRCVKDKLNISQDRYEVGLKEGVEYLSFRNSMKVLKAITRESKK